MINYHHMLIQGSKYIVSLLFNSPQCQFDCATLSQFICNNHEVSREEWEFHTEEVFSGASSHLYSLSEYCYELFTRDSLKGLSSFK